MVEAAATLADWRTAPHNRRAFHHVREIVPSADIPNERGMAILHRGREFLA